MRDASCRPVEKGGDLPCRISLVTHEFYCEPSCINDFHGSVLPHNVIALHLCQVGHYFEDLTKILQLLHIKFVSPAHYKRKATAIAVTEKLLLSYCLPLNLYLGFHSATESLLQWLVFCVCAHREPRGYVILIREL